MTFFRLTATSAAMAAVALAQVAVTVSRPVASGTVTANTLVVDIGSGVETATATNGQCTGVALSVTAGVAQVANYGTVQVSTSTSPTQVLGDLVLCPSGTMGQAVDAGTSLSSGVPLGTPIVGRILATGSLATVQLFGPGVFGSQLIVSTPPLSLIGGLLTLPKATTSADGYLAAADFTNFNNYLRPVTLGFHQATATSSGTPTGSGKDAYTYQMTLMPNFYTPPAMTSSYAAWWIDRGGFGTIGNHGTTLVAPDDLELFRLSAVTQTGTRENTLEVFDYTMSGLGSVPGSFFNEAGFTSQNGGQTIMYGINSHTSGCNGTKCGGTMPNFLDSDVEQIGIESDVEERSGTGKTTNASIGVYSVCVNCNNSGKMASGMLSPNVAFLADSKIADSGPVGEATMPWGSAFQSTPGAALTGVSLGPVLPSGLGQSDAQPITQCAFTAAGGAACTKIGARTVSSAHVSPSSPVWSEFLNASGTLSPVSSAYNQNTFPSGTTMTGYTLGALDLGAYWTNGTATADITFTLPAPIAGSVVYFVNLSVANKLNVVAASGTKFCYVATCTTTGGTLQSSTPGSFAKVYSAANAWYVEYESGSWVGP